MFFNFKTDRSPKSKSITGLQNLRYHPIFVQYVYERNTWRFVPGKLIIYLFGGILYRRHSKLVFFPEGADLTNFLSSCYTDIRDFMIRVIIASLHNREQFMTVIKQQDFIDSIFDALQYISYYHPVDFVRALKKAYEREQNPAAKNAIVKST